MTRLDVRDEQALLGPEPVEFFSLDTFSSRADLMSRILSAMTFCRDSSFRANRKRVALTRQDFELHPCALKVLHDVAKARDRLAA